MFCEAPSVARVLGLADQELSDHKSDVFRYELENF